MPNQDYVLTMARYNHWQNENIFGAADTLSDAARALDRGAFFGSIRDTASHLFWGDQIWMHRFAGTPPPDGGIPTSTRLADDWDDFRQARRAFDRQILQWAHVVSPDWFHGDLSWFSGAVNREVTKPKTTLVVQLFNHQTHHRGQIHAMLTAAGAKPSDTDVPFMPDDFAAL